MAKLLFLFITIFLWSGFDQNNVIAQEGRWVAPSSAKEIKNPVAEKKVSASAKKGAKLFKKFCIVCHGETGEGNGPGSKSLNPKPANLTSELVQNQVDGEIFWKISNGRNAMIKWGPIIPEEDRWDLTNYIRTLK